MTDLLKLAERVEAATGPEQRLILTLAHAEIYQGADPNIERFNAMLDAEAYESAAMALVPEGWPSRQEGTTDDGAAYAALAGNDGHMMAEDPEEFFVEGNAVTPALALTAAALRARAAMEKNDE